MDRLAQRGLGLGESRPCRMPRRRAGSRAQGRWRAASATRWRAGATGRRRAGRSPRSLDEREDRDRRDDRRHARQGADGDPRPPAPGRALALDALAAGGEEPPLQLVEVRLVAALPDAPEGRRGRAGRRRGRRRPSRSAASERRRCRRSCSRSSLIQPRSSGQPRMRASWVTSTTGSPVASSVLVVSRRASARAPTTASTSSSSPGRVISSARVRGGGCPRCPRRAG